MIDWSAAALMLAALGGAPGTAGADQPMLLAQLIVREQIMVRVPIRRGPPAAAKTPVNWKESRGPKCVPAARIAGAAMLGQNSVDLVLKDHSRVRARLERSCPALDYYYGFYITPNADGMICADRDIIRSRMGGECGIDAFRKLRIEPKD